MPGIWPDKVPEIRQKRPEEELILQVDFNPRLSAGDLASSVEAVTVVKVWGPGDVVGVNHNGNIDDGIWVGVFSGGEAPSDHEVEILVRTTGGNLMGERYVIEIRA